MSVFFFERFQLKYSRNLLGLKYDLTTRVAFNLWIGIRQISAASNSHRYLILLVSFWKMMSFETKWSAFFGAKSHCCLVGDLPQKQCGYADETLSFQDSAIRATQ